MVVHNNGSFRNEAGGVVDFEFEISNNGILTNRGSIVARGALIHNEQLDNLGAIAIGASGDRINFGTVVNAGSVGNSGSFQNSGKLVLYCTAAVAGNPVSGAPGIAVQTLVVGGGRGPMVRDGRSRGVRRDPG